MSNHTLSAHSVGFIHPLTEEKIYITKILTQNEDKRFKTAYEFSSNGDEFPSKNQAKRFRYYFRLNFTEEMYQQCKEKSFADLPLDYEQIIIGAKLFNKNQEMLHHSQTLLQRLEVNEPVMA